MFSAKSDFITISSYPRDAIIAMSSKTRGEIEGLIPIVKAAHPKKDAPLNVYSLITTPNHSFGSPES